MKTVTGILLMFAIIALSSCEGPVGPPGPPGEPGEPGVNILGSVFEIEGDFTEEFDYTISFEFPADFEIYESDIVLVYILWSQDNGTDIWRLLPQTIIEGQDIVQYNFDYTIADVLIYLTGNVDTFFEEETQNQIFRIAVLPADFVAKKSLDIYNYNEVMKSLQINQSAIKKVDITKL
ncbi:MAG: hypothetical protein ACOC11_01160 [Prolixibacteraceae bacterium]